MKKIITYFAALLALVLTTACEQKKWTTELPEGEVEVLEFYNIVKEPNTRYNIYSKDRGDKLPMMIEISGGGVDSYELLDYEENLESGDISFRIEEVSLATNDLMFVSEYTIKIDYLYGFAKITIETIEPGSSEKTTEVIEASYRTTKKLN